MEVIEKDERYLEMEARIYAPLEWDSPPDCKIQDLKEPQYDEALRLIKHHFFREEPMAKASKLLDDQSSVNCYLTLVRTWMRDTTSLVALSISSGRVIGVAVTRINSNSGKIDTYNRVQILEGGTLKKIMHLRNSVLKQCNAYDWFGHDTYLGIYILSVHPTYQEKGIAAALLRACVQNAIALKMPAVGGVFTSGTSQSAALSAGFELLHEIRYNKWVVEDIVVFDDPGRGNYSAAFMGRRTQDEANSGDQETSC